VNMCLSLVKIRSVTSEITRQKKNEDRKKNQAVKYKPFGIAMPCGLVIPNGACSDVVTADHKEEAIKYGLSKNTNFDDIE